MSSKGEGDEETKKETRKASLKNMCGGKIAIGTGLATTRTRLKKGE